MQEVEAKNRNPHNSYENKFENGDAWDRGETRRRHVLAERVELIGKKANGVGEFGERIGGEEPVAAYTISRKATNG